MDKVNISFKYELENGKEGTITIRDVHSDASIEDIQALSDIILEKNTKINGNKPIRLIECVKSVTTDETLDF